jgi:hypothetical protein
MVVTSFEDIEKSSVENFGNIYTVNQRDTIFEVVKMTYFFPNFIGEEGNSTLMEEVSK